VCRAGLKGLGEDLEQLGFIEAPAAQRVRAAFDRETWDIVFRPYAFGGPAGRAAVPVGDDSDFPYAWVLLEAGQRDCGLGDLRQIRTAVLAGVNSVRGLGIA
jgi:hypothetical protein